MGLKKAAFLYLPALVLLASVTVSISAAAAPAMAINKSESGRIKTYREWKSDLVQEALARVTATKTQREISRNRDPNLARNQGGMESASGLAIERLEAQLQADQNELETARNFSVTDYLAGYLMKVQNKKAAFKEVAAKLTADEIVELMSAYANTAFGAHSADFAPSANSSAEDRVR
jgi:hypothetical protein